MENTCESGGTGRRTGLRIQPALPGRGSSPLSRTKMNKASIRPQAATALKREGEWMMLVRGYADTC